jgi:transketolase
MISSTDTYKEISPIAYHLARLSLLSTSGAGSGHPTSCLSMAPALAILADRIAGPHDRLVLSKGHAAPILYSLAVLQQRITETDLIQGLRQLGSLFPGHPTPDSGMVATATGSLGQGLAIGLGQAIASSIQSQSGITYVIMGDAECAEGSVWEAARTAPVYGIHNLVVYIDYNGHGQLTAPIDTPEKLSALFTACGWRTISVSGTNYQQLIQAFTTAQTSTDRPTVIIGSTPKGFPITWLMKDSTYHGKVVPPDKLPQTLEELAVKYGVDQKIPCPRLAPILLTGPRPAPTVAISEPATAEPLTQKTSVRAQVGQRVAQHARQNSKVLVFDADVGNSTYMELTKKNTPHQYIQAYVAEQLMIGMAVGAYTQGYTSVASTFGAFFTRAHDQLRMAAISRHALRCIGTHVGVSIGPDGPSQMALEDIALFAGLPGSIILYPCDSISATKSVDIMMGYTAGVTYIRSTREETPNIYTPDHRMTISGCFVHPPAQLSPQRACIITAGITVHEALKAQKELLDQGVSCVVIDLYSVKPFDHQTVDQTIAACNGYALVVEDHYQAGGIGQIVMSTLAHRGYTWHHTCVTDVPGSGSSKDLLAHYKLDAAGIIDTVIKLVDVKPASY